jgi:hypothetical protein
MGIKQLELDADHSQPPSAEVRNVWNFVSLIHDVVLEYRKTLPEEPSTMQAVHKTNMDRIFPVPCVRM